MPFQLANPREAAFYRAVGANIRRARELGGLRQGQVADRMGLHRTHASRFESGARRLTLAEFLKLLKILGVSIDYLLEGALELAEVHRQEHLMPTGLPQQGMRFRPRCPECGGPLRWQPLEATRQPETTQDAA